MKSLKKVILCLFCFVMMPFGAVADKKSAPSTKRKNISAHVHGIGSLSIAIDEAHSALELEYIIPAFDVLGFEHEPKSKEDKKIFEEKNLRLKSPLNVFQLVVKSSDKKAACEMNHGTIDSPYRGGAHHHDHDHASEKGKKHEDHADYKLRYTFRCKNIDQLKGVKTLLFDNFESLKSLQAVLLEAEGASPHVLNRDQSTIYFRQKK